MKLSKKEKTIFLKIFGTIFLFQSIIILLKSLLPSNYNSIFNFLESLISLPLRIIHPSYPFYIEGSGFKIVFLVLINLTIQSIFVFLIYRGKSFKK